MTVGQKPDRSSDVSMQGKADQQTASSVEEHLWVAATITNN